MDTTPLLAHEESPRAGGLKTAPSGRSPLHAAQGHPIMQAALECANWHPTWTDHSPTAGPGPRWPARERIEVHAAAPRAPPERRVQASRAAPPGPACRVQAARAELLSVGGQEVTQGGQQHHPQAGGGLRPVLHLHDCGGHWRLPGRQVGDPTNHGLWVLGAGCWVLGAGCWVLGAGCWVLGAGCWVLSVVTELAPDPPFAAPRRDAWHMHAMRGTRLAAQAWSSGLGRLNTRPRSGCSSTGPAGTTSTPPRFPLAVWRSCLTRHTCCRMCRPSWSASSRRGRPRSPAPPSTALATTARRSWGPWCRCSSSGWSRAHW